MNGPEYEDETFGIEPDPNEIRYGSAQFGPVRLEFFVAVDESGLAKAIPLPPLPEPNPNDREAWERYQARRALAKADTVEGALRQAAPGLDLRIEAPVQPATDTAGPGLGIEGEFIRFLISDDPVGRVADLLALAIGIRSLRDWLGEHTHKPTAISDGIAVILAAEAVEQSTGTRDTTVAFVAMIPPAAFDYAGPRDGYVVGLRAGSTLFVTVVGLYGRIIRQDSWPVDDLLGDG